MMMMMSLGIAIQYIHVMGKTVVIPVLAGVCVTLANLWRWSVLYLTVAVVHLAHGLVDDSHA